jgi:hypothetical protein
MVVVLLLLGAGLAPAEAQVYWVGSTTQSLPMHFEVHEGAIDEMVVTSALYCPKSRTALTVQFTLSGVRAPVQPDGHFTVEHMADQFYVRVSGVAHEATALASGIVDVNWAALVQKARGALNVRRMASERCFAREVRWDAFMALAAPGAAAGREADGAADYRVRLENGPGGTQLSISAGP